ncbi:hypothetical protein K7G98_17620 [Saccharothrix sp. MB29]|nr:hypothetical protein [Saccharothrix sp. MB29]
MARAHAARRTGAKLSESHDMSAPPSGVDVLYTTRWQTTGTAKPDPDWRGAFAPFQVGAALWDTNPDAVFMHDLPAHRGEEVTAEVLDGPMSIAFRQATNKMWTAMAVVEWCRATAEPIAEERPPRGVPLCGATATSCCCGPEPGSPSWARRSA